MQVFCACNSMWVSPGLKHGLIQLNIRKDLTYDNNIYCCPDCGFYSWYDANYENEMRDLKEMNQ